MAVQENSINLRAPKTEDMGWIVKRHGAIYLDEYGWDERFEALVAGIVAQFIKASNPERERCWIAHVNGQRAGSILVVEESSEAARLRLLLVEPWARGLGVGTSLVREGISFARLAGYSRLVFWTNSVLTDAARIYKKLGFRLISEEPHRHWGVNLVGQTYELIL